MIKVFCGAPLFAYSLVGCAGPAAPEPSEATVANVAQALNTKAADAKVVLCHLPPGDPKARHTITVSASAVSSHLAHGDTLDECPTTCTSESCDDGDPCTVDVCGDDGACSHSAVNCDDANPCTVDSCTAGVGCTSAPVPGTVACDDGNDCTAGDTCANGACRGQAIAGCCFSDGDCADANLCTTDRCVNHACANSPVTCGVADPCLAAFCDPATGACGTTPVSCDDGNACTDDACDSSLGCTHQPTCALDRTLSLTQATFIESGRTGNNNGGYPFLLTGNELCAGGGTMRALIQFTMPADLQGRANVSGAELTMFVSRLPDGTTGDPASLSLFAVTQAWGQGRGNNPLGFDECNWTIGQACNSGEATWNSATCGSNTWSGGAFVLPASAVAVDAAEPVGAPIIWHDSIMARDVQAWIDTPSTNHGWLIESAPVGSTNGAISPLQALSKTATLVITFTCKAGFTQSGGTCI